MAASGYNLQQVADFLTSEDCQNVIIAVGAGISCSAGIPDFRTKGSGLYANEDIKAQYEKYGLSKDSTPEDVMTLSFYEKHPELIYKMDRVMLPIKQWKPTVVHYFMKLLENKNKLRRVYTQNIDGLETTAGVSKDNLVHAHGTMHTCSCMKCKKPGNIEEFEKAILTDPIEPLYCDEPDCDGLIRHDCIFFNEQLPERFMDGNLVDGDMDAADLFIVSGTSLAVKPFNSLPNRVRKECPRILINREKAGEKITNKSASVLNIDIKMGTNVEIDGNRGIVRWVGNTKFGKAGLWYGVELDVPHGKNNGTVEGKEYFRCEENHGIFVRKSKLVNLDDKNRRRMRKGFEFEKENTKDLFVQGDADDGFMELARLCGWEADLRALIAGGSTTSTN